MKRWITLAAIFGSLSAFAASPVYVLDRGGKSVARLDVQRGAIEAGAALPFKDDPADMVFTPDGQRLLVVSNTSAAIVDTTTLSASPRLDLGRAVADIVFTRDGKSALVLSADALFRIDLATASVTKRVALDRAADQFGAVSEDTGVVFSKGGKYTNAQLSFVSLDTLESIGTVLLTGKATELISIPGAGFLYAVENNAVDVISIAERRLAGTLPAGNRAKLGAVDAASRTLYVTAVDEQKNGVIHAIRGASLAGSSSAGTGAVEIFRLSAGGTRAFAGNARGVTEVSLGEQMSSHAPASIYSGFVANSMTAFDSALAPDGRRVLLLMRQYDKCCTLAIADPAEGRKIATMQVGRKSRRVAQALLSVAATAASFSAGRADAKANGRNSFTYTLYSPGTMRSPRGAFAFSPDGKTAYVLDSGTDSVTAVDVDSGKRLADLDAPGNVGEVVPLGERTIVATGQNGLTLIDHTSNTITASVELAGELHELFVLPGEATALALSKGEVAIIDGGTGKVSARVSGLVDPIAAVAK